MHNLRCINPYLSFSSMVMPHAVRSCVCLVHAVWPTSHSYYAPKCGARTPGSCPARMLPRGFITTKSLSGVYVLGPGNPGGMLSESSRSALSSGWPNGRSALFVCDYRGEGGVMGKSKAGGRRGTGLVVQGDGRGSGSGKGRTRGRGQLVCRRSAGEGYQRLMLLLR